MSSAPVPPQNLDAEESVLGAMLLAPGAIDACAEVLVAGDFYRGSHGVIYGAALELYARGESVDAITVTNHLEQAGKLEDAGGRIRVHELAALVPATANASHYARIVRATALDRELIRVGQNVARLGWERPGEPEERLARAEQLVFDVAGSRERSDLERLAGGLKERFQRIMDAGARGDRLAGLGSGFESLDRVTAGFAGGQLVVIAARPSMGKSALALGIAAHVALEQGVPVAVFSLEMSRVELIDRLLALRGNVSSHRIRTGRQLSPDEWARLAGAADELQRAPLYVDDNGSATTVGIRAKARRLKAREKRLGLVIVDYLQLLAQGPPQYLVGEVSQISRSLKVLAKELDVPVIALSQLSRAVEQRHDKRPMLSDLRESGAIEQDADVVIFLYRDEYYHRESDQAGVCEVNVAKQRSGPTQKLELSWQREYAKFRERA